MLTAHLRQTVRRRLRLGALLAVAALVLGSAIAAPAEATLEQSSAAILSDRLPGFNDALAQEIAAQVRGAGYAPSL
jgi:hypothetical protein